MSRWHVDDSDERLPDSSTAIQDRAVCRTLFAATSGVSGHTQMRCGGPLPVEPGWYKQVLWRDNIAIPVPARCYFFLAVRSRTIVPPCSVGGTVRSPSRKAGDAVLEMSLRRAHPGQFERRVRT
ncbi:hypothetical protein MRX96_057754 [Rhipicephalus microplus]